MRDPSYCPSPYGKTVFACLLLVFACGASVLAQMAGQTLEVRNETGAGVAAARLLIYSAGGALLRETRTQAGGIATIAPLPAGSYRLIIAATGYATLQLSLDVADGGIPPIVLRPEAIRGAVTITARRGAVENIEQTPQLVHTVDEDLRDRPLATIGNALERGPGILAQQSAPGQVSPFLRGLTGYQVLNLLDGVRFNNTTFRSGPNQYLAFIDTGLAQRVEAMPGPAGAQYGSDALGGIINVLTTAPVFPDPAGMHGEINLLAAMADAAGAGSLGITHGGPRHALLLGGSWNRRNDLRAGQGLDSHHVLRRFFGLSGDQVRALTGARLQDTGFFSSGLQARFATRFADTQSLTLRYQAGVISGVRGYKDLWGGLGRLRSDFTPQELHFAYARYERPRLGWLDRVTGTFSINAQRDGTIRQNLRVTDRLTTDDNRVNVYGYSAQAGARVGPRHTVVFGGELWRELIRASRVETDPVTSTSAQRRALYPDGSRYATLGLFTQHNARFLRDRLRAGAGVRFTRVGFETYAARNRTPAGLNSGVTDARGAFYDTTGNAHLSWRVSGQIELHALAGRGFRAPNMNDLGALGLNDLGYEIPGAEAVRAGALMGHSDGETALPN
ncbi:MAG: TonB-dependent receptor, partial [Blastocatellia bacterium]